MLRKLITDKSEIDSLKLKTVLSYDWETTSLNYLEMLPVGLSFCDGNNSWYIPFKSEFIEELTSVFNKDILFVAHNQVFDLKCCQKFLNVSPPQIFCTKTAAKLIDDTKYNYSLDSLANEYLGFGKLTTWEKVKQFGYDSQQFYDYAMQDSELAFQLWQIQKKELKEQNLEHLFYNVEMTFTFVLRDMEINGCLIDKVQLEILASEVSKRLYDIEEQMLQVFGKTHQLQKGLYGEEEFVSTPINFGSNPTLVKLIESLGFQIKEKTAKGEKSVGKETLLSLRTEHKFIDLLWLFKKLQKLQSTYVANLRKVDSDGRLRPSYNLVRSGRVTCSPLQQMPNPKKEENKEIGLNFRKVLVPAEGYKFVCADFCFDKETQILTENGWYKFRDLPRNVKVAQYENGQITYDFPLAYQKNLYFGEMIHILSDQIDLFITPNHKCLLQQNATGRHKFYEFKVLAKNYPAGSHYSQPNAGLLFGNVVENEWPLKLIAAIQADGKERKNDYIIWLKRKDKIERLINILDNYGCSYRRQFCITKPAGNAFIIPKDKNIEKYLNLGKDKTFNRKNLLMLSIDCRDVFLNEVLKWDGWGNTYYSTNLVNCEIVQELSILSNHRSFYNVRIRKFSKDDIVRKPCGSVSICKRNYTYIKCFQKKEIYYNDFIYCVTMPKGTLIVRRNGKVCITGNSGQELRVGAHVCNCRNLIKAFNEDKDPHLMTANDVFDLNLSEQELTRGSDSYKIACKKYESKRDIGKNGLNFPIMYGTTAGGIAKRKGVSYQEANRWIEKFFKTYPEIKISIDKTKEELYNNGYVEDMMGRRRRYPDYKAADKQRKAFIERSAFNHKIQGFSASMSKIAAAKTLKLCKEFVAKIIMFVHDELVFEVKLEQCQEFAKRLNPIMCNAISLKIPIEVDVSIKETF